MELDPEQVEISRHRRYIRALSEGVANKARAAIRLELGRSNSKIPEAVIDQYVTKPRNWLKTVMVRVSIEKLYRRYKCIRIRTLTETLHVVEKAQTKAEIITELRKLIVAACESTQLEIAADEDFTFSIDDCED